MKTLRPLLLLISLFSFNSLLFAQDTTPTPFPPRPVALVSMNQGNVVYQRYFPNLLQGQVGVLHLIGENISEARALFRSEEYRFNPTNDGWYALLVADIDSSARDYPLSIAVQLSDGTVLSFNDTVTIANAGFIRQTFAVPNTIAYLTDPEVEREEFARIESIVGAIQSDFLWGDGFQTPITAEYTSGFGQYRILNQNVQTRHTGWDQRAPVGTPVMAMADGEVAFVGQLSIRGNYILINHGWGVYTGYAHLSETAVRRGERVARGQIIGSSGNTGRSSGAHLHWEIKVNGEWVDGDSFIHTWLPNSPEASAKP